MNARAFPDTLKTEQIEAVWRAPLQPVGCPACKQVFLAPAAYSGRRCPVCDRAPLAPQPAWLRPEPPELILPFALDRARLAAVFTNFTHGVWLAPQDFTPQGLLERATPVFLPLWLVDADLDGSWESEAGFPYQVKSSQEYYSGDSWRSREVVEDRLRWEPRAGQIRRHYDNICVPALSDHARLTQEAGTFGQPTAFDPACLGGAVVRVPDLGQDVVWPQAEKRLHGLAERECQQAAGAQQVRNFVLHPAYANLHWTQMLLPVYHSYYTGDDGQPIQVYVNAQTGQVGGLRVASQRRGWRTTGLFFAIALLVLVVGLLATALTPVFPPAALIGGLAVILGVLGVVLSVIPIYWAWQFNRKG